MKRLFFAFSRQKLSRQGFTLLEMLMVVGLSCILLYGLMRVYISVTNHVAFVRHATAMQRSVGLVFYQLRADLSSAFIPETLYKDELEGKVKNDEENLSPEKKEAIEKASYKSYFILTDDDRGEAKKIEGERRYPLKQLSFLTTNPLHVYDQKQPRIVRVVYELQKNKKRSTRDRDVFSLIRKEVSDIADVAAKGVEGRPPQSYVVTDNVQGVYISAQIFKKDIPQKKDQEAKELDEGELVHSATWGEKDPLVGVVPRAVTCWLSLWLGEQTRTVVFTETIQLISYPSKRHKADAPEQPTQDEQPPAQPAPEHPKPEGVAIVRVQGD
jgi:prepilin-type N-terminal cleavage/methylation domain-containing protein